MLLGMIWRARLQIEMFTNFPTSPENQPNVILHYDIWFGYCQNNSSYYLSCWFINNISAAVFTVAGEICLNLARIC